MKILTLFIDHHHPYDIMVNEVMDAIWHDFISYYLMKENLQYQMGYLETWLLGPIFCIEDNHAAFQEVVVSDIYRVWEAI